MATTSIQVKERILAQLQTLPVCKPDSARRNWVVRCPYCGDSKTANHGHFSILIDMDSDAPIMCNCFKCKESGILTTQTLEDLGLFCDSSLAGQLSYFNMRAANSSYFKDKIKRFTIPQTVDCVENLRKVDYINRRLGANLTFEDCESFKIILSFIQFIQENHIPLSNGHDGSMLKSGTVRELDRNYVGFLSANNNKIIFRDVTPDGSGFFGRYYKVTIDQLNVSPNSFYALINRFNLLYTDPIDIHIAEGTFDILGVYLNIEREQSQNSLFFANGGYGFGAILKYLIYTGVTTDINLHIYSDADKSDEDHLKLLSKPFYQVWLDDVRVHRNAMHGEKDFGVSKDLIQDYSYKLKI